MKGGPASQSCGPAKRIDMKILRALALKIGYDVHSTKRSHLTLAQHLPKVLISHQISTVIDVGANAGQFATKLRAGGFTGRIKSFEPIPLHAQKVAALFAEDKNHEMHHCALGATPGTLELNVYKGSDLSSFLQPSNGSRKYFGSNVELMEKIRVPVRRLDQVEGIVEAGEKVLLKLDTQGYDLKVFEGATNLIPSIEAILVECSAIALYENAPNFIETLSVFSMAGFVPSGFFPICRDEASLALIEFDCLLVRRQSAAGQDTLRLLPG